jgi:hypothetical protein
MFTHARAHTHTHIWDIKFSTCAGHCEFCMRPDSCDRDPHYFPTGRSAVILQDRLQRAAVFLSRILEKMYVPYRYVYSFMPTDDYKLYFILCTHFFKTSHFWRKCIKFRWNCVWHRSHIWQTGRKLHLLNIATRLRVGRSGVRMPAGLQICLFFGISRPVVRPTQSPLQWVPGSFCWDKAAGGGGGGGEFYQSPPSNAGVENE